MKGPIAFAALFVSLLQLTLSYGQTTPLRYRLQKNDVFTVEQRAEQLIIQEVDGATHEVTNTVDGLLEFKVLGKKEEAYRIRMRFKDLNLKIESNLQGELMSVHAMEVDENDVQSKVFHSLLNSPVELVLAPNGAILEVVGGDSLVRKMIQASGLEEGFSRNIMKKSLEAEFGSEALSHSYEQMTFIYPTEPLEKVKVGSQWDNAYTGQVTAENTWTLTALTDTTATIQGKADITLHINEPSSTMDLEGTQETQITTNPATGFLKEMKVKGLAKGTTKLAQLGDQGIPTTIKSSITYKLKDIHHVP